MRARGIRRNLHSANHGTAVSAVVLAVAGLQRSGNAQHATHILEPSALLPAAGQGALALQCRMDDHVTLSRCLPLNDTITGEAVHAERQIVAGMECDCSSPIAVYAEPVGKAALEFIVRVRVLGPGGACIDLEERSQANDVRKAVKSMIATLKQRGAIELLRMATAAAKDDAPAPQAQPTAVYESWGGGLS